MTRIGRIAGWAALWPSLAFAQAQGTYPGTLLCEAGAGRPALRAAITVEVAAGRSTYLFRNSAGRESGTGTLTGRRLVLVGSGTGPGGAWQARYAGEIAGTGGLLVGQQTSGAGRRACQLTLGDGRG